MACVPLTVTSFTRQLIGSHGFRTLILPLLIHSEPLCITHSILLLFLGFNSSFSILSIFVFLSYDLFLYFKNLFLRIYFYPTFVFTVLNLFYFILLFFLLLLFFFVTYCILFSMLRFLYFLSLFGSHFILFSFLSLFLQL